MNASDSLESNTDGPTLRSQQGRFQSAALKTPDSTARKGYAVLTITLMVPTSSSGKLPSYTWAQWLKKAGHQQGVGPVARGFNSYHDCSPFPSNKENVPIEASQQTLKRSRVQNHRLKPHEDK